MLSPRRRELFLLFSGDIAIFYIALWATLTARYWTFPGRDILYNHLVPFTLLFAAWVVVFFIAGLYEKHTIIFKRSLLSLITYSMVVNILLAAVFFFLVPFFGIAPKTNLAIYLAFAIILIPLWRVVVFPTLMPKKRQKALLIGNGPEVEELITEVNNNERYNFEFVRLLGTNDLLQTPHVAKRVKEVAEEDAISIIVADAHSKDLSPVLPLIFGQSFLERRWSFVDFSEVYEDIFDRIPLSKLEYGWFLAHTRRTERLAYDLAKRAIDIGGAMVVGVVLLFLYPWIALAIKLEDGGDVFIAQKRLGRGTSTMTVYKFRTMTQSDSGTWKGESANNKVTTVGAFLRKTSLDELPQVLNIIKGEMSLIGPRNDIIALGERLKDEIPYYEARYVVRPGITGWAQTHQLYAPGNISPQSVEESRLRLSYDLYYVKHRSLLLDSMIALRTFATLLSRFGIRL